MDQGAGEANNPLCPIVIVGTGRCGSTLIHRTLASHSRLAWLSQLCERRPNRPGLNAAAMNLLDTPVVGGLLRDYLDPAEPYRLWERMAPGFAEPDRDLESSDLRPDDRARIRDTMRRMLTRKRDRLLLKITGWPRIRYLDSVFDRPHYIHVYRDGRAVAASLLNVPWWRGRQGPDEWRWGSLDPALRQRWEYFDRSPATLAGIQWEILMDAIEHAGSSISSDRYTRVRYEDFCSDPVGELRRITTEARLSWSTALEEKVGSMPIRNANPRWKDRVETVERDHLEVGLMPALQRYGYA